MVSLVKGKAVEELRSEAGGGVTRKDQRNLQATQGGMRRQGTTVSHHNSSGLPVTLVQSRDAWMLWLQ